MNNIWREAIGPSLFNIIQTSLEPWGFKDNKSFFVYANDPYKKLLNIPKKFDVAGRKDGEMPAPTSDFEKEFQLHDRKTEREERTLSSLEVHPFGKEQKLEAYCFEKMPCFDKDRNVLGTIFHGIKLSEHYIQLSFQLNQLVSGQRSPMASFVEGNDHYQQLDDRQHELLFLLGLGFNTKEIAARLQLSKRTVENNLAIARIRFNVSKTTACMGERLDE